jgi:dynein assembly factor 3, axonemal
MIDFCVFQSAFTFWKNKKDHVYDISKYWDDQNRVALKQRYDHRDGAFDWDLQMRLRENGAKQICPQEYKHWRETGVAFTFPEFEYSLPNKTFAMDLRRSGNQWFHRGYIGDMGVGPFITFGLDCSEEAMKKSSFGTNQSRSTDVTERNVYELIWEIQNGRAYDSASDNKNFRQLGSVKLQLGEGPSPGRIFEDINPNVIKLDKPMKPIENVKIFFLPVETVLNINEKQQFLKKFDVVFVAHNYFPMLKEELSEVIKDEAIVLIETKKYSLMKRTEINENIKSIKDFCNKLKLQPVTSFALNIVNSILKYKRI